ICPNPNLCVNPEDRVCFVKSWWFTGCFGKREMRKKEGEEYDRWLSVLLRLRWVSDEGDPVLCWPAMEKGEGGPHRELWSCCCSRVREKGKAWWLLLFGRLLVMLSEKMGRRVFRRVVGICMVKRERGGKRRWRLFFGDIRRRRRRRRGRWVDLR
ncbi:hypothetical protein HAX54_046897, partial [Datura stramonium]|nr:hypothetical protein [Datura stramonium]